MALTAQQERTILQRIFRLLDKKGLSTSLTKPDFKAMVAAINSQFSAIWSGVNSAIPEPAQTQLTTKQKAFVFMLVADERYKEL